MAAKLRRTFSRSGRLFYPIASQIKNQICGKCNFTSQQNRGGKSARGYLIGRVFFFRFFGEVRWRRVENTRIANVMAHSQQALWLLA